MKASEIEQIAIEILQEGGGKFLFPYQIFNRIKQKDQSLADKIENAYPTDDGKPIMGEGAGIYYSAASFVAQALNSFRPRYDQIKKEWLDVAGLEIEAILPGNKDGMSIWAWEEENQTQT